MKKKNKSPFTKRINFQLIQAKKFRTQGRTKFAEKWENKAISNLIRNKGTNLKNIFEYVDENNKFNNNFAKNFNEKLITRVMTSKKNREMLEQNYKEMRNFDEAVKEMSIELSFDINNEMFGNEAEKYELFMKENIDVFNKYDFYYKNRKLHIMKTYEKITKKIRNKYRRR